MFKKKKVRRKNIQVQSRESTRWNPEAMTGLQENIEGNHGQHIDEPFLHKEILLVKKETACMEVYDESAMEKEPPKIADSLLMQLEEEVIGFINRRIEEHITRRIKGMLLPVAKLSLKMNKMKDKFLGGQAEYLSDLEDDLEYILESSKLRRISPKAGEKFSPSLHEEVDFSWNPEVGDLEILASVRDGFFWEYNQEVLLKSQVVVNRRVAG
ncbi:MAG: nucleotide exchange factor GrpE [bacterium]